MSIASLGYLIAKALIHFIRREMIRLQQLWSGLKTREDVIRAWGAPDEKIPNGYSETEPTKDGTPTRTVGFDVLRYNGLSSTAVVDVILGAGERVRFSCYTKPKST